jgi:Fic family protein
MSLQPLLNRIDELQAAIEAAGKFDPEVLKKINYKFRLDWNYHSNAMEGNSLTKEETRSVMVNNVTVEGKPLKDVLEIKGHDQVISDILKIGKGEVGLSEKRIKDIHKAIIHEDNPEKKQKIGQWKTENNHLINYKHEKFDFKDHSEVPEAMHQLINWLNAQTEQLKAGKNKLHPALIAFEFHLKYLTIHPFYDGNGRTARILTNLILISFGYPPVIIKKDEKEVYYRYLADVQGYGGNPDLYYEFMCKLLIHSQELVIKAIEGESIEDPDDLDKGIELLKRTLAISSDEVEKTFEVIIKLWEESLSHLKDGFLALHTKFQALFENSNINISAFTNENRKIDITEPGSQKLLFGTPTKIRKLNRITMISEFSQMRNHPLEKRFIVINIVLLNFEYTVSNGLNLKVQKKYSESFTKTEIDDFIYKAGKSLLEELNQVIENNQ